MSMESYPNELLDIDFLISSLYNYLHSKETGSILPSINYKNIDITDIKLLLSTQQQNVVINSIFNTNITFDHRKLNKYVFKRTNGHLSTDVTLVLYTADRNNMASYENSNALITWILSDLVIKQITKGILLNIMVADLKVTQLKPFIETQEILSDFESKHDNMYFQCSVSEHFYKKRLLSDKIALMTKKELMSVLIQVASILQEIHNVYPTFRHNMLTIDSLVYYEKKPEMITIIVDGKEKQYNDYGFEIKITDFDSAIIIGLTKNDSILHEKKIPDKTYDILTLMKNINTLNIIDLQTLMNNIGNNFSPTSVMISEYFTLGEEPVATQSGGGKKKSTKSKSIRGSRKLPKSSSRVKSTKGRNDDRIDDHSDNGKYINEFNDDDSIFDSSSERGAPIYNSYETNVSHNGAMPYHPGQSVPYQPPSIEQQISKLMPPNLPAGQMPLTSADLGSYGGNHMGSVGNHMGSVGQPMGNPGYSMRSAGQYGGDGDDSDDEFIELTETETNIQRGGSSTSYVIDSDFFFRPK